MTQNDLFIKRDRMRYTKDGFSSGLVLLAIVFNVLYFVSIYQVLEKDVDKYYYTWMIGASVIYNLLFLLIAFLASQGVKNRKNGFYWTLLVIGALQIVRIFYLPAKAAAAIRENGQPVMGTGQHTYVVICLAASAVCCVVAAVSSYISNQQLAKHMRQIENQSA